MEETFEERYNVTEVYRKMFVALWRDNGTPGLYFVSVDGNFIDKFYAKNDEDAIERFEGSENNG